MSPAAATVAVTRAFLAAFIAALAAAPHQPNPFIHMLLSFGIIGVFFVSIVDSSFVPLPIPGITDILTVVLAAQHANLILLIGAATAGSALGGLFSHKVGQAGGMAFLEKHVSPAIFKRVRNWMEKHAILSVALPAVLPPPMPLSPFVLAAGALKMSRRKFMTTFTISRGLRHSLAAWLGVHYGRHVLRVWNMFTRKYGTEILIAIWTIVVLSAAFAFWRLYKTSREMRGPKTTQKPSPARA